MFPFNSGFKITGSNPAIPAELTVAAPITVLGGILKTFKNK